MRPPFIAIEGMDGVGKNTTTQYLKSHVSGLIANGDFKNKTTTKVVSMSSPDYNTPLGKTIKSQLNSDVPHICELITLFADNRAEQSVGIIEEINNGSVVICDRWTMSMLVYASQQMGMTVADKLISSYEVAVSKVPIPSLYIVLTASPDICMQRMLLRYKGDQSMLDTNEKDYRLQEKVGSIYKNICDSNYHKQLHTLKGSSVVHIDAGLALQNTLDKAKNIVDNWLFVNNLI